MTGSHLGLLKHKNELEIEVKPGGLVLQTNRAAVTSFKTMSVCKYFLIGICSSFTNHSYMKSPLNIEKTHSVITSLRMFQLKYQGSIDRIYCKNAIFFITKAELILAFSTQ